MNARSLVRKAIVDALTAAEALDGVTVTKGWEPDNQREWIWVRSTTGKREFKVLGPRPLPTEEEIEVLLRVIAIRNKPDDAADRAEALADVVEEVLRDVEVAKLVLGPLLVKKIEDEPLAFDAKAGHHYLMTISTRARI